MTTGEYATLRDRIAAEKAERYERYRQYRSIYEKAQTAGREAGEAVSPIPMIVSGYEDQPVVDGVCGFAWVNIRPGNSSFARWLKKENLARTDSYNGGVTIWISAWGQSYERKMAHAEALAESLKSNPLLAGAKIYASGRLD